MQVWGVEGGDAWFRVEFDSCSDQAWSIVKEAYEGSEEEDTATREVYVIVHERFCGETLADAITAAWEHAGRPVHCEICDGVGELPATKDEVAAALAAGRQLTSWRDVAGGEKFLVVICSACAGEGLRRG